MNTMNRFGFHSDYKTDFKRLDDPAGAVGKTITQTIGEEYDDTLAFAFSDKTYLYVHATSQDEDSAEMAFFGTRPSANDALRLGLIDQGEYDRSCAAYAKQVEAQSLERKLKDFEKLKKELEAVGLPKAPERTTTDRDCDPDIHGY